MYGSSQEYVQTPSRLSSQCYTFSVGLFFSFFFRMHLLSCALPSKFCLVEAHTKRNQKTSLSPFFFTALGSLGVFSRCIQSFCSVLCSCSWFLFSLGRSRKDDQLFGACGEDGRRGVQDGDSVHGPGALPWRRPADEPRRGRAYSGESAGG